MQGGVCRTAKDFPALPARSKRSGIHAPPVSCRIRVLLPEGTELVDLTRAHPDALIEIVNRLQLAEHHLLFDVRVTSEETTDWGQEIGRTPGAEDALLLEQTRRSAIYRVRFAGRSFVPVFRRLGLMRQLPITMHAGWSTWTVLGTEPQVHRLLSILEASRVPYSIAAVHRVASCRAPHALTERQSDIFVRALGAGYFDVPRGISLSALASQIGVAASTLSVTLAVIEKKIVEAHLRNGG